MFSRPESGSNAGSRLSTLVLAGVLAAMICLALGAVASAQELSSQPAGELSAGSTAASGAAIASDKADYAPGEHVVLTGAGWQPGETVHVYVQDDEGRTWQRSVEVTADDEGGIVDEFDLPRWFVATYSVVATGAESGVATTSFTDSNFAVKNASSTPDGVTVSYRIERFAANACTGAVALTQNFTITGRNATTVSPLTFNTVQVPGNIATRISYLGASSPSGSYAFDRWQLSNQGPTNPNDGSAYAGGSTLCIVDSNNGQDNRTFVGFSRSAQQAQQITFNAPPGKTYGDPDVALGATASSGLPVSYSSSTTDVCTIVSGAARLVGAGTCTVTASQAGNASYLAATSVERSFGVAPKTATGSFTAPDKVYDGTTGSTIGTRSLAGVINGDQVSLTGGSASFGTASADTGKTVTGTGFSLTGAHAGRYSLASSTLTDTSDITPKGLTSSFTAADKAYDGNTGATISGSSLGSGVVDGDAVTLVDGTAAFNDKTAGSDKVVDGSGFSLTGDDAGNYSLTQPASTTASITPIALTSSFTAADKEYDGLTTAAIATSGVGDGVLADDDVELVNGVAAFDDAAAGEDKPVTGSDFALDGADAANYTLSQPAATTADITPKAVAMSFTAADKDYDGTTDATITGSQLGTGTLEGDDVELDDTAATAAFRTAGAGTGKPVDAGGFGLSGDDAANYSLTPPDAATATIRALGLGVSFAAEDKDYDGTTDAEIASSDLVGDLVGEDDVSLDASNASAAFDSAGAGAGKTVNASGFALSGDDAGNYSLTQPEPATATIRKLALTSGFTADDKEYDGGTGAEILESSVGDGVLQGDDVALDADDATASFRTAAAGEDKPVDGSGFALSGDDAGNYELSQPPAASADITPKPLSSRFTAQDKEYDGTTAATIDGSELGDGVIEDDDVSLVDGDADFRSAGAGEAKPVDGSGFELAGDDAGNYLLSQPEAAAADITPATLAVDAGNASKDYGDADPTPPHTLSGFKNGEDDSVVSGSPVCTVDSSAGPNPGVYPNATSCQPGTLSAGNYVFESGSTGTFTIDKVSTTLVYGGDSSVQYSDVANLSATLTHSGSPVAGKEITFTIGSQSAKATTDAGGVAATTLTLTQAPANTTVQTRLPEDALYAGSTDSDAFTIRTEDATTSYTGGVFVPTSSPTSGMATVLLSTTVTDAADGSRGDIRNARVEFFDRTNPAVTLCAAAVGLVAAGDTTVGSAGCEWKPNIGTQESVPYTIGTRVKNRYARDDSSENAVVTVSKLLTSGFITGGGYFVNGTGTAGQVAAAVGKKTNFGFNVKYNKSGTNLQGSINTIIRSGARTFQVKGNAMTSLTSNSTQKPATATFEGKSSIQDITDPLASVPVTDGGGAILRVTMRDAGEPGTSDMVGVTVWTNKGALWYSSLWSQGKTVEQLLGGGNLVVR